MMTCDLCGEQMEDVKIVDHLRVIHPDQYDFLSDDPVRFLPGPECDLTQLAPDERVGAVVPYGWAVYRSVDKPDEN